MLRLSEEENQRVIEFHKVHEEAKRRRFSRLFRSPALFEDMVKCILLCNCQWPRTLSMARALCELQVELRHASPSASNVMAETRTICSSQTTEIKHFALRAPLGKESKRRFEVRKFSKNLANKYAQALGVEETKMKISTAKILEHYKETRKLSLTFPSEDVKKDLLEICNPLPASANVSNLKPSEVTENDADTTIGNFPSPRELASLDETFLARHCNLGYRSGLVINLARAVVEGRIQLRELEYACGALGLSVYDKLAKKLRTIDGFGPFTCANVHGLLTCHSNKLGNY